MLELGFEVKPSVFLPQHLMPSVVTHEHCPFGMPAQDDWQRLALWPCDVLAKMIGLNAKTALLKSTELINVFFILTLLVVL